VPIFPSEVWCRAAIALMEADPELPAASAGWKDDLCVVVLPDAHLREPFAVHIRPEGGRIADFRVLGDLDEADALDAAIAVSAPYAVWKGLLLGTVDPIEALFSRKIQVKGNVQPLIERARFKGIIERVLTQLETEFPDGATPGPNKERR